MERILISIILLKTFIRLLVVKKKECNIKSLLESLEAVIFNPNNIYDHQKKVFIEQCMKHPKVFGLMIQPRNNKGKTEAAIQRFHPTMRNLKEDSKCKN